MAKQLNPLFIIELQGHSWSGDLETEKEWFKAWLYDHAEFRNKIDRNIGMPGNLLYDVDQEKNNPLCNQDLTSKLINEINNVGLGGYSICDDYFNS